MLYSVFSKHLGSLGSKSVLCNIGKRFSHYDSPHSAGLSKMTLPQLQKMHANSEPIVCITAHDAISARIADRAGVDLLLVGDSLAMVSLGYDSTTEVELEDMIYHTRAVLRGSKRPFLVADLPFGSYELGPTQATESALRMIKKGGAEAVKFEGGQELVPTVSHLASYGIATMPHIGLTPQRAISTGGFKVQGSTSLEAMRILEDAVALQEAGASMLLLEGVPAQVAKIIATKSKIPIIGIGAGPSVSGQVLVQLDMLGGFDGFTPKFLKRYSSLLTNSVAAIEEYRDEVRGRKFPTADHTYKIKGDELRDFKELAERLFS